MKKQELLLMITDGNNQYLLAPKLPALLKGTTSQIMDIFMVANACILSEQKIRGILMKRL